MFGGTVTRSELVVVPTQEENGKVYSCEADNDMAASVTTNITLNVLHGPVWVQTPPGTVQVAEGEELVLTASAVANPGPISYSWWRGPSILEGVGVEGGQDGRVKILRMGRHQSGKYSVIAHGPSEDITAVFNISVLSNILTPIMRSGQPLPTDGPEEAVVAERVVVDEEGPATILCSAEGNPTPNVTWTRDLDWDNSSRAALSAGLGEARIVLEWATQADTGLYTCLAANNISAAPPATTAVVVTQPPVFVLAGTEEEEWGRTRSAEGTNGRVECRVRAAPAPSFTWSAANNVELHNNKKYYIHVPQLVDRVAEWISVLVVRNITPADYGLYTCTAHNSRGSHASNYSLSPPIFPDVPLDVNVTQVSSSTAVVTWRHNRMGAPAWGYTIRYRTIGKEKQEQQIVDARGPNRTKTVIEGLSRGLRYAFTVQAYNEHGRSNHSLPAASVHMLDLSEGVASSSMDSSQSRMPRLILLLLSLTGTALLIVNVSIIVCFLRRRAQRRNLSDSSSKFTLSTLPSSKSTFDVYAPAVTPPAPHVDHLPLTAASTISPPDYQVECHTADDTRESASVSPPPTSAEPQPPHVTPPSPAAARGRRLRVLCSTAGSAAPVTPTARRRRRGAYPTKPSTARRRSSRPSWAAA
ncbi:synaptogenesis protein syg-2-like [Penaeus monodon]|uniref:synaptogenesis protein syg-2-like n=1 Tax=Penaeus monodon TaxID=6687 RepID=UPI0018A7C5FC|nr:synaptogenesis protein syg-2-like [Penaeus monodon]